MSMPNAPSQDTGFRLTGKHVLAIILAFFGVTIAVNGFFISAAVRSFPGEDVPRSYVQGLHYNETLAEREAQAALGWRASADFVVVGAQPVVEVRLIDRNGAPIDGASLTGELRRPAEQASDAVLVFEGVGDGRYRAAAGELQAGRWEVRARAERGEDSFDLRGDLQWLP